MLHITFCLFYGFDIGRLFGTCLLACLKNNDCRLLSGTGPGIGILNLQCDAGQLSGAAGVFQNILCSWNGFLECGVWFGSISGVCMSVRHSLLAATTSRGTLWWSHAVVSGFAGDRWERVELSHDVDGLVMSGLGSQSSTWIMFLIEFLVHFGCFRICYF